MIAKFFKMMLGLVVCSAWFVAHGQDISEVKIGIAGPMTGSIAHLGKDLDAGARLALDEINAQSPVIGGKKIVFVPITVDDQANPQVASRVAHQLVEQKVVAVVGHLTSGASIPASRIYANAAIPQISPSSTNPVYTHQGFTTAFRDIADDNQQMKVVANFVFDQLKLRKVAVIDDHTPAGQGQADMFAENFKRRGGTILTRQITNNTATDFMAILTAIKATNPDLILFGGMDAQAAPILKQMKELKITAPLFGTDGMATPEFIRLAGDTGLGSFASSIGLPKDQMPGYKDFSAAFGARYGQMQAYAPYSYDAVMILFRAMQDANSTDPAKFAEKIRSTDFEGVTGHIKFDEHGDLLDGSITIYKINKDKVWEPATTSLTMR